jgi:transcriptional regulator with XRE-family HTH domain
MKKTTIGNNFKKLRLFKGLNQTEFAELIGVTRSAVGSYEEGRAEPKLETLMSVADEFKLKVDDIIRKELTVNQIAGFRNPIDSGMRSDQLHSEIRRLSRKIDDMEDSIHKMMGDDS